VKKADRKKRPDAFRPATPAADETGSSPALEKAMPKTDPAYPILAGILGVVPVSRWMFARAAPNGDLVSLFASHANAAGLAELTNEFKRQRMKSSAGPRIAATLGPLDGFASGITLLFADARTNFGILTLLRNAELGPFTSSEISVLTFALDAVDDCLSALRFQAPNQSEGALRNVAGALGAEAPEEAFYILDSDFQIVLAWTSENQRRVALTGLHTRLAERLPIMLEETVRELTAAWSSDSVNAPGVARPVPFLVVRTQPMSGPAGLFIGVHIDRFQTPNSLIGAASRFHISPRELQVLALLLDGKHLDQIAERLYITSSTVQDHIKSMLDKTESGNRSELIARVLGWESTPSSRRA
jgi:DNA-binding CsgD family transcriptional regulator